MLAKMIRVKTVERPAQISTNRLPKRSILPPEVLLEAADAHADERSK